jgi:hypothetical protein
MRLFDVQDIDSDVEVDLTAAAPVSVILRQPMMLPTDVYFLGINRDTRPPKLSLFLGPTPRNTHSVPDSM